MPDIPIQSVDRVAIRVGSISTRGDSRMTVLIEMYNNQTQIFPSRNTREVSVQYISSHSFTTSSKGEGRTATSTNLSSFLPPACRGPPLPPCGTRGTCGLAGTHISFDLHVLQCLFVRFPDMVCLLAAHLVHSEDGVYPCVFAQIPQMRSFDPFPRRSTNIIQILSLAWTGFDKQQVLTKSFAYRRT